MNAEIGDSRDVPSSRIFTHWKCQLHGVIGALDGESLTYHQDDYHDGVPITVLFFRPQESL